VFTQSSAEFDERIEEEAGPSRIVFLWIIILGLTLLFLPLYLIANTIQEDIEELEAQAILLQSTLASTLAAPPQEQQLAQELADLQAQAGQIEALLPVLANQDTTWPAVMAAIDDYSPAQLELLGVSQTDRQLIIRGRAVDDGAVDDYARRLETSGQFNSVVVQSIALVGAPFQSPTETMAAPVGRRLPLRYRPRPRPFSTTITNGTTPVPNRSSSTSSKPITFTPILTSITSSFWLKQAALTKCLRPG